MRLFLRLLTVYNTIQKKGSEIHTCIIFHFHIPDSVSLKCSIIAWPSRCIQRARIRIDSNARHKRG